MIFFTSDWHVGHENAIHYCNRPFASLAEMEDELVSRWNRRINATDTVYVLGDLALCSIQRTEPIVKRLNGVKYLIKGNHDSYSDGQYARIGFSGVYLELKLKLFGCVVRLSHYPYALPWYRRPFAYESELRFMEKRPPRIGGEILLHGHTHTKKQVTAVGMIHVGVDAWDFYPVSLSEIESLWRKRGPR